MDVPPRPAYTNDHKILMVHCPYPTAEIKEVLTYPTDCTHFVSLVLNYSHFAVLYYDLHAKAISVFDGLNWVLTNWQNQIIHTITSFGETPYPPRKISNRASCDMEKQ